MQILLEAFAKAFLKWQPFGQAIFIIIVLAIISTSICAAFDTLVSLIRGRSQKVLENDEEDENEEEE